MSGAPLPNASHPAHAGGPAAFGRLIDSAVRERGRLDAPTWALHSGELAPQLLCRYAAGAVTGAERAATQELLARHPWALQRVSRLVQGKRSDAPLAAAVLVAAGAGEVDAHRLVAAVTLRSLGADDAAAALERDDREALGRLRLSEGLPAALCSLGAGDLEAARAGLAQVAANDGELLQLAQRLSATSDPDEALVEVLQAV